MQSSRVSPSVAGFLLALLSAATFGTSGAFARALIDAGWSPGAAVLMRIGGAALVLAYPTYVLAKRVALRNHARLLLVYGAVAVAGVQLAYFNSIRYLSPGVALLIEYLAPTLLVGWMWLRHRARPTRMTMAGVALSIAGLLLVLDVAAGGISLHLGGVAWALLAAVGLAFYFVLSAKGEGVLPPLLMAGAGVIVGAMVLLALAVAGVMPVHVTSAPVVFAGAHTHWLVPAAGLVLLSTVTAYVTGIFAVRRLGPTVASFAGLTEVLFTVLWAWVLIADLPTPAQLVGGSLIVAGVAAVKLSENRKPAVLAVA